MGAVRAWRLRYLTSRDRARLVARLNRAIGQVAAVHRMVEKEDCADRILLQIAAAKAVLTGAAVELVERHRPDCAQQCMGGERRQVVRPMARALAAVVRQG